ncbi:OmpP1/FadL family transporter [Nitrogeniibacter aestuarii]|uniref:OmpP1/FadL family transporter n=1 Tax=Nitrogeniibacter aestuarii TaxID=2815343 RepID=UPI001E396244|nr:porin [Nitrogeniibacter aestuarii]
MNSSNRIKQIVRTLGFIGAAVSAAPALATQGTFPHGYGVKSEGMGGVGIALPQDAVAGATNPAGMVEVGTRADIGMALLQVDNGAYFGGTNYDGGSEKDLYLIPQLGVNYMIDTETSIGLSVVGNGVGTAHDKVNVGGMQRPKSEYKQMVSTVSLARRITPNQRVGVGLVLAYQRLALHGPGSLGLPQGHDSSFGYGLSLGWQGKVLPNLTLGATYASKIDMGRMDKFDKLLADDGDLDAPEHYGIGAALNLGATTLAADVMRILWSDVKSLGNPGVAIATGAPGDKDGPGFGWRDQTVWRFGVAHQFNEQLTLRAGYNQGNQILDSASTYLGIVAPSANRKHWTLGATYQIDPAMELSVAYARSPKERVKGDGPGPNGSTDLYMGQDWLSLSLGMRF